MTLSPTQDQVVISDAKRIAVVAGPGTGKTRTLVERIKHRAAINPEARFLVMTFTNAGARELIERLDGVRDRLDYIGTLHGYCFRLLQTYGKQLGYRPGGVTLLREDDAETLLKETAAKLGYKGSFKALQEKRDKKAESVWVEFAHVLKRNNVVDYDTILEAGRRILTGLLVHSAEARNIELYVDECQDGALIDWQIYAAICAEVKFFVGDTDQSVFRFRGAAPEQFLAAYRESFMQRFILDRNYRSATSVCARATNLIQHNVERVDKSVVPVSEEIGDARIACYDDDLQERRDVANKIVALLAEESAHEIAVLVRTNWLADQFRGALEALGVPVQRAKRHDLPMDFSLALDVISLMVDPRSDLVAERVIKALKPKALDDCKAQARDAGAWLSQSAIVSGVFPDWLEAELHGTALGMLPRFGIGRESCDLITQRVKLLPGKATLADLLHDLFAHDRWDPEKDGEERGVIVSTLHSAKGREFNAVFMPALEEGIAPSLSKSSDIEEERRLAFVGMTRARFALYLSSAKQRRPQFGPVQPQQPSRFISEAGF